MTYEQMQETMAFIVEQQKTNARLIAQLTERQAKSEAEADQRAAEADRRAVEADRRAAEADARLTRLEQTVASVVQTVQLLVELVQTHDARMDEFVKTIERYVQARGNNGSGA